MALNDAIPNGTVCTCGLEWNGTVRYGTQWYGTKWYARFDTMRKGTVGTVSWVQTVPCDQMR